MEATFNTLSQYIYPDAFVIQIDYTHGEDKVSYLLTIFCIKISMSVLFCTWVITREEIKREKALYICISGLSFLNRFIELAVHP